MSFRAFSRTRILRAKAGIEVGVERWWAKQRAAEGEVRYMMLLLLRNRYPCVKWLLPVMQNNSDCILTPLFSTILSYI